MSWRTRLSFALGASFLLLGAFASPSLAQRDPKLSDSQVPGSVIVFPKFVGGTVTQSGYNKIAQTEIKVGVVCPKGATCSANQRVTIRFHWVCPGDANLSCKEGDFEGVTTVNGKLVFNAAGQMLQGNFLAPVPPCPKGYLIGWVINPSNQQPIKFDGLIGDAVLRESRSAVTAYNAIPIQADPALANGALITLVNDPFTATPSLAFDGNPGHYLAVTGVVIGDVQFDRLPTATKFFARTTSLILLTLDVRSNQSNYPTFVDLNFYSASEVLHSTSTRFVCWQEIAISAIDPGLTEAAVGTRDGIVVSDPAAKVAFGGIADTAGPVTLLGLVETVEGNVNTAPIARAYVNGLYNDAVVVPTMFVP